MKHSSGAFYPLGCGWAHMKVSLVESSPVEYGMVGSGLVEPEWSIPPTLQEQGVSPVFIDNSSGATPAGHLIIIDGNEGLTTRVSASSSPAQAGGRRWLAVTTIPWRASEALSHAPGPRRTRSSDTTPDQEFGA